MRVLDLFSGIGGFSLGLERAGMRTVAFCEIDPFCRRVLAKHWPGVPCHDDIKTREFFEHEADVICGGFPCQDISSSGNLAGITSGARSGLWSEFARAIRIVRPDFAIVENVSDLLNRGLDKVLGDLASLGYDAEWHCVPAAFVGLPQARERVWIIAYPDSGGREGRPQRNGQGPVLKFRHDDDRLALGQRRARDARSWVRRRNDGIPDGVHRLRALGNAVVPQIPQIIGEAIMASRQFNDL